MTPLGIDFGVNANFEFAIESTKNSRFWSSAKKHERCGCFSSDCAWESSDLIKEEENIDGTEVMFK